METRSLSKSKQEMHGILRDAIGKALSDFLETKQLSDVLPDSDKILVQVEILHDVLNKVDVQEWIMTEKIVDKMEAKT